MTFPKASSGIGPSRPTMRPAVPMPAQLTSTAAGRGPTADRDCRLDDRRVSDIAEEELPADFVGYRPSPFIEIEDARRARPFWPGPGGWRAEARTAAGDDRRLAAISMLTRAPGSR